MSEETEPSEQTKQLLLVQWRRDFCPVATDLLDRLVKELSGDDDDQNV